MPNSPPPTALRREDAARRGAAVIAALALGATAGHSAAELIGYSVGGLGDGRLYRIDLTTGAEHAIGPTGFGQVLALSFRPDTDVLYGVDALTGSLVTIDITTGAGALVGPIGIGPTVGAGLAWDDAGHLWMANELDESLYAVDPATGQATYVGSTGQSVAGLASRDGVLYGLADDPDRNLVTIDPVTGVATTIGPLGIADLSFAGIDFDASGNLWGIVGRVGGVNGTVALDLDTGAATFVAPLSDNGFGSLAILPSPAGILLLLFAAMKKHRRRTGGAGESGT